MSRSLIYLVAVLIIVVGVFFSLFTGYGWSAQIRIDTGDLRYCLLGIPLWYDPLPEKSRSDILSITSKDPAIDSKWYTCAVFPKKYSNNVDGMTQGFYTKAALWVDVDRKIAHAIIKDIVIWIKTTKCQEGLPDSVMLISSVVVFSEKDGYKVDPNWRKNEFAELYLEAKGLLPKQTSAHDVASQPSLLSK